MFPPAGPENNWHYRKDLRQYANDNRKSYNLSERTMWKCILRNRKLMGYQFRRERPILFWIADFACLPLMLVIEVDGITHLDPEWQQKDRKKDALLRQVGFTVLRINALRVLNDLEGVRAELEEWIREHARVPPRVRGVRRKRG